MPPTSISGPAGRPLASLCFEHRQRWSLAARWGCGAYSFRANLGRPPIGWAPLLPEGGCSVTEPKPPLDKTPPRGSKIFDVTTDSEREDGDAARRAKAADEFMKRAPPTGP